MSQHPVRSLEEIYNLPDAEVNAWLISNNIPNQSYYIDRLAMTILYNNAGLLRPEDQKYVLNPRFKGLYQLQDDVLIYQAGRTNSNRFQLIRAILSTPGPSYHELMNEEYFLLTSELNNMIDYDQLYQEARESSDKLKSLLKQFDFNFQNERYETPLILASQEGHIEMVKYLISVGANLNLKDVENRTALKYASQKGYGEIVNSLIAAGADINF